MATAVAGLSYRIEPRDQMLVRAVETVARATNRSFRPLHLQALLQLPRIADDRGLVSALTADVILCELARDLPVKQELIVSSYASSPGSLQFHEVEEALAYDVMARFHYLRSPRTDGRAYGLSSDAGDLIALSVSSPLDVSYLRDLVDLSEGSGRRARVISRVFAFESAPKNSISYLLSRVARVEKSLGVESLITYVNPNMGFSGSSYRASGWQLLGDEPGTTYRYLDSRYITDRQLEKRFGAYDDTTYRKLLGSRFSVSTMRLVPLLVFYRRLV